MVSVAVLINLAAHPAKEENQQNAERTSKTHLDNAFLLQRVQQLRCRQRDRTRAHKTCDAWQAAGVRLRTDSVCIVNKLSRQWPRQTRLNPQRVHSRNPGLKKHAGFAKLSVEVNVSVVWFSLLELWPIAKVCRTTWKSTNSPLWPW